MKLFRSDAKGRPMEEIILGFYTQLDSDRTVDSIENRRTPLNEREKGFSRGSTFVF